MKIRLILILMLLSNQLFGQTVIPLGIFSNDTVKQANTKTEKLTGTPYISPVFSLYTGSGSLGQRTTFNIEVGKQWDVLSFGVDIGKNNLANHDKDTTWYIEVRPSLNVFQQGKFTNTLSIGLGYIFGAKQNTLTEFTTGIEYTPTSKTSYNLFFGTYYYSGRYASSSQNFVGLSMLYYLRPHTFRGLFNKR